MKFIATKTENGQKKGETSFYCRALDVTRQGFYNYVKSLGKPWKHTALAAQMQEVTMSRPGKWSSRPPC
jgi:hypothetical protein